jgi:catalase
MQPAPDPATHLAKDLIQALDDLNGVHPGFRPAHAKGAMLSGAFTPSPEAASLTKAPHTHRPSTPVTVRFSDSAGFPTVADNDPQFASPRGIAIRFHLADHVHTDIVAHSHNGFPTRTPEEFLEFLRAAHASGPGAPKPSPIEIFLGTHPAALAFVQAPKPIPASFASEPYFAVTAHKFINADGGVAYGRYRIHPEGPVQHLDAATAAAQSPNFLFDELAARIAKGAVKLNIAVQLAAEGDTVDNATIHWPEDRPQLPFGTIELTSIIPADDNEARRAIFDPIPRVDGIESSGDPLLATRADVYLLSGRRRRSAAK